jgi:hypothetical protein
LKISIENALGADDFGIRRPRETLLFPSAMMRFAAKMFTSCSCCQRGIEAMGIGQ